MTCLRVLIDASANPVLRDILTPPHFELVEDPEKANAILFGRDFPHVVTVSPYYKNWREKCIVITEDDLPTFILPAIYASNHRHLFGQGRTVTYSYFMTERSCPNLFLEEARKAAPPKKYLLAFLGGSTSWVRKRLFLAMEKIDAPDVLIRSTDNYNHWDWSPERAESRRALQKEYAAILSESRFFLCPRGAGSASVRLFEVMEMGVCPVILADDYIFPEGPAWNEFALIVPERDVARVEEIVRAHAGEAEIRGRRAREEYQKYFGREVQAETVARMISQLLRDRSDLRENTIQFLLPFNERAKKARGIAYAYAKRCVLRTFHVLGLKMPYRLNRPLEQQIGVKPESP